MRKVLKKENIFRNDYTILSNAPYKIKKQIHYLPDYIYTELGSKNDHMIEVWDNHKVKFSNGIDRIVFYYREDNIADKVMNDITQNIDYNELHFLIKIWIKRLYFNETFDFNDVNELLRNNELRRGTVRYYIDDKIGHILYCLIEKASYVEQHPDLEKEVIPILKMILKHYGNKEINPVYESYPFLISFIKDMDISKSAYDELYNVLNFIDTYISNSRYEFESKNNNDVEEV